MVDWLKELSLFDHFMHGLFKYLNEHTPKLTPFAGKYLFHLHLGFFVSHKKNNLVLFFLSFQ